MWKSTSELGFTIEPTWPWGVRSLISTQVEEPESAFWAGIARRRAAAEARWAEARAAHDAAGRGGTIERYRTEFATVWGRYDGFQVQVAVDGGATLYETYRDLHVAALVSDIARIECDRAPLNYPNRSFCRAVPPPPDVLEKMMRQAAGGGSCVRVVVKDPAELVRVRYVVKQTLALEMATDRRAFGRRLVEEARKRGGVVGNDDLYDELAERVDAADYERLLGDRLRAEGFAAPPGNSRGKGTRRAAPRKKRSRASSDDDDSDDDAALPAPTGQWTTRADRAAKRAKRDA